MTCDNNCSYRGLYHGAQASLTDMAARHAATAGRVGRLRSNLIQILKVHAPRRFALIEKELGFRMSDADDITLLSVAQNILQMEAVEDDLTDVAAAIAAAGFPTPTSTDPADLIAALQTSRAASPQTWTAAPASKPPAAAPIPNEFSLPPGITPSMLPGVTLASLLEAQADGSLADMLERAYREYQALQSSEPQGNNPHLDGVFDSTPDDVHHDAPEVDPPVTTSTKRKPASEDLIAELELDLSEDVTSDPADASSDADGSDADPTLFPVDDKSSEPPSDTAEAPKPSTVRSKPSSALLYSGPARREPRPVDRRTAQVTATPPANPEELGARFFARATSGLPAFASDLIDLSQSPEAVDQWINDNANSESESFRAFGGKDRDKGVGHGAMIIPIGATRDMIRDSAPDSIWVELLDRHNGRRLYESALFLRDNHEQIVSWTFAPENTAIFTRVKHGAEIEGFILTFGKHYETGGSERNDLIAMIEQALDAGTSTIFILGYDIPLFDKLQETVLEERDRRNWMSGAPVVAAKGGYWVSGDRSATQLF